MDSRPTRTVARIGVSPALGPTLEAGLGLGLAGKHLVAVHSARNGDVGPPSSRLTTRRKLGWGAVDLNWGHCRTVEGNTSRISSIPSNPSHQECQLRWLGHLFRMPPGRLPREVFQACPTGRRPRGRPRTRWRDYVSWLAWERLGIPCKKSWRKYLGSGKSGYLCLDCYLRDLVPDKRWKMDGWMDGWMSD
ncbi:hypothetical protein L3Q82_018725, partial [Scortum barcoo]